MKANVFIVCLMMALIMGLSGCNQQKNDQQNDQKDGPKNILFDLSHSQCRGIEEGYETYPLVIPGYEKIASEVGANLVLNEEAEITSELLKDVDVLVMLSPLSIQLQKNLSEVEKHALINFVKEGHSLIFFVDDDHRVNRATYGANDVTRPFGIEIGAQAEVPGNCGAVSFENEIFSGRLEIPYSGACLMKGGIPASVSMESGLQHSGYVVLPNGGKIFVAADTMVGLLLGYPDGVRNDISMKMATRWWGKDSYQYMKELITWALK